VDYVTSSGRRFILEAGQLGVSQRNRTVPGLDYITNSDIEVLG